MPRETLGKFAHALWRVKGTILIQIVIISVGLFTRELSVAGHQRALAQAGFDYELLLDMRFRQVLTGTWIQSAPGIAWSMIALVFVGTVFLELLVGTWAMLVTCVTGDWVATILTVLTLRVISGAGGAAATVLLAVPDSGTSALAHAGLGATVVLLPHRWRMIAVPILILLTAIQLYLVALAPAIVHCWAVAYGMLVGWFLLQKRTERKRSAPIAG